MKKVFFFLIFSFFIYLPSFSQLTATFETTINELCQGTDCDWDGPSILINEIMLSPSSGDGSISGNAANGGRGEWIELYNPDICNPVDISCYYLGNSARVSTGFAGGGFQIPNGTIVPPGGFCLVRGVNAPAVPSANLVENGGNVVEVIVPAEITDDGVCVGEEEGGFFPMPGTRLWFPNAGGWFAFYNENGEPQDAISWGDQAGIEGEPCVPEHSSCNTGVTSLPSYVNIPNELKEKVYNGTVPDSWNQTIRRVPDGSDWVANQGEPNYTMGGCNDECAELGSSSCAGTATINVSGGSGNYSYLWDDSETQMTQTAVGLCEGTYTVTVTDNQTGEVQTFTVEIENLVIEFEASVVSPTCDESNGEIIVTGTNGESPYTYTMDNGSSQSENTFDGLSSGVYEILIRDANGCIGTDVVEVFPSESSNPYFEFSDFCDDEENGPTNIASDGGEFSFNPSVNDGATIDSETGVISNGVPGTTYTVQYVTADECGIYTVDVTIFETPQVNITADVTEGEPPLEVTFESNSSGADEYTLDFGDGGATTIEGNSSTTHIYWTEGTMLVILTGTTEAGCTNADSLLIKLNYPDMTYVYPNVFTPNGDKDNDFFTLAVEKNVASLEIVILNRWGNVVFESDEVGFMWNGQLHNIGGECEDGTYFYRATMTNLSGESRVEHGFVHLLRN